MRYPSPVLLILAHVLIPLSAATAISLDGLTSKSPFLPYSAGESPTINSSDSSAIEFRGVITGKNGPLFGLYDRSRNQGSWVHQNEKGAEFNVVGYDANNETVTVNYQGQKLVLALSTAKISSAVPSRGAINPIAQIGAIGTPQSPAIAGTDKNRLEAIAAEVRRRRALRQAPAPADGQTPAAPTTQEQ
jgi:hypothetical protein